MSELYDSDIDEYLAYQEESEHSDAEYSVQKDSESEAGYGNENEYSCSSDIVDTEEEDDDGEDDDEEEREDSEDTENEERDSDDCWEDNPHLDLIDIHQNELLWYLNYFNPQEEEQECNIDSFEDFFFSSNGIGSLNDLRGFSGVNDGGNRFVMLGDSLASGGAYEYHNSDGSYYSQRADGSIVRRDKFGRESVTPPERNPRMGRRYHPY